MTYSSSALAMQRQAVKRNQNGIRLATNEHALGPVAHTIVLAVMLCVLGLIYLTQVTKTNAFGYQLSDLKARKQELVQENQDLQVQAAQLQASDRVQNSQVTASLPAPVDVSYVQN